MNLLNKNFLNLSKSYLFSTIADKVRSVHEESPEAEFLNLGVGDVALPLAPSIVAALKDGATEMGERVHGYGPAEGYSFLREKIKEVEYGSFPIDADEIFVSEGIVRDICDIQELFDPKKTIGVIDPAYPAYFDTSVLAGRTIYKIPCTEENGFIPKVPNHKTDVIYLCSPMNPTGVAMTRNHLKEWVDWALEHGSILLFDAAYETFISSSDVPKTIYEVEGAKKVAIEFRSFSKSAGFTGLRLGYTVVPKETGLNEYWRLRQDIKTNGVSYPIQKAGMAALSGQGKSETEAQVALYKDNAKSLKSCLESLGFICYGGTDSPYLWWKINDMDSWSYFDFLLKELHLIAIPGKGFGPLGEGFMRLSSFISEDTLKQTVQRLQNLCAMK